VGHSKSKVACDIARQINAELSAQDFQTRVGADTESVFHDRFWDRLDLVVNAVDNVHARLYVDKKCVWHGKPLLESGTLGTKANSQVVIPHKTQCYGDSQDPPEEAIPMCTLRNFPNQIEHCIEWGRDMFNRMFHDIPKEAVAFLSNHQQFLEQLKKSTTQSGMKEQLQEIQRLVELKKNADFFKCVEIAKAHFDEHFDFNIRNLLHMFPEDHKDKDGQPFWSGPKRAPVPLPFDKSDSLHVQFVLACANLIAFNLGIGQERNSAEVA